MFARTSLASRAAATSSSSASCARSCIAVCVSSMPAASFSSFALPLFCNRCQLAERACGSYCSESPTNGAEMRAAAALT